MALEGLLYSARAKVSGFPAGNSSFLPMHYLKSPWRVAAQQFPGGIPGFGRV